jgi:hypothetical protein
VVLFPADFGALKALNRAASANFDEKMSDDLDSAEMVFMIARP